MTIKKKIITAIILCLLMTVSVLFTGVIVNAKAATLSDVSFSAEYQTGETLTVPSAKITVDGVEYDANKTVIFPNGKKYQAESVDLTVCGIYTVEYSASVKGRVYKVNKTFSVIQNNFSTDNTTYGEYGLRCVLNNQNKVFKYNKVLDLTGITAEDVLFEFAIELDENNSCPTNKVILTLTDVYDENNQVTVWANIQDVNNGLVYFMAGFSGSKMLGAYGGTYDSQVISDGVYGNPAIGQNYTGKMLDGIVMMDYDEKAFYVGRTPALGGNMISDLDSSVFYKTPWKGFTTGEVYATVTVGKFLRENIAVNIKQLLGEDLSAQQKVEDTKPPKITVDYGDYTENDYPDGLVGIGYPVFGATAYDVNGLNGTKIEPRVFLGYNTTARREIDVIGGKFYPDYPGEYSMVYSATDAYGNVAEKVVPVIALKNYSDMQVFADGVDLTAETGKEINVSNISVVNAIGKYSLLAFIEKNGTSQTLSQNEEGGFDYLPTEEGVYVISITAKDYLGREAGKKYEVEVQSKDVAVFTENPVMPKYLYDGYEFRVPKITAYNYTLKKEVPVKIFITDKNGKNEVGETCTPQVNTSYDAVTFTYSAEGEEKSYSVPVIKVGDSTNLKVENFFVENADVGKEITENGLKFLMNKDSSVEFSNKILAEDFSMKFDVDKSLNAYTQINLILTDSENSDISLKFAFVKSASKIKLFINDGTVGYGLTCSFTDKKADAVQFGFVNSQRQVSANGVSSYINTDSNGNTFNGFPSRFVNFKIEFVGVSDESAMWLYNISKQLFTSKGEEFIKPSFVIDGSYGGTYKAGDVYTLYKVYAGDVLSQQVTLSYTVTGPDKKVVTDKNGVKIQNVDGNEIYQIELTDNGKYKFDLTVEDQNGNLFKYNYNVNVADVEKPVISIDKMITEAKVGKTVELPTATVTDNVEVKGYYVYVIMPNGVMAKVTDNKLNITESGTYKVIYYAFDSEYNSTEYSFDIVAR